MGAATQQNPHAAPDIRVLEEYLYHEARLIDEMRLEEWSGLFTEDGTYWVPATAGQPDPVNHVSLMYEDRLMRAVRIERYKNPNAISLQPQPRCVHLVSNVMLEEFDPESGDCIVSSRFVVFEYRRAEQFVYGGTYRHDLAATEQGYRIRQKKVELVNCDGPQWNIQVYL